MVQSAMAPPRRHLAITLVLAAVCLSGTASAQVPPRAIAVIDATAGANSDRDVANLAARLESQLDKEDKLVPVASDARPALVGGIPAEGRDGMIEARRALSRTRDAMARFDHTEAITEADTGIRLAADLAPSAEIIGIIADLALVRGLARRGEGKLAASGADFALVHRLDPGRTLDPVKYLPEVITAFEKAAATTTMASLDIDAPAGAEVWLDGAAVGPAPATVQVSTGLHCIAVTGETLVAHGQVIEVPAAGAKARIEAPEASGKVVIHRLRSRLAAATDDAARAEVIGQLIRLVGGQDAILVGRDSAGELVTWIYSGKTGALGTPQAARSTDGSGDGLKAPDKILAPLRPIDLPEIKDGNGGKPDDGIKKPLPPPVPWFRRRWIQASIGGTIIAGVLTSVVLIVTRDQGSSGLMEDGVDIQ